MKLIICVAVILMTIGSISAVAKQEKIIKKPLNLKPTKGQKTVLDQFKDHLTPEDAEFIKQIDQQFKVHGSKLSIKIERDNNTKVTNKNTKRTIDDSLGYSYQQNMHDNGYYFSRPIYMHKFTSHDVPHEKGYTNEKATDIEIQQSHSYEIKTETQYENQQNNYHQKQKQVYDDPIPVIVLRVPGPSKYALHLQALLQQYLELRAAQFIKVLEEQERHGQLMHPQHYVPQQEQIAYIPMVAINPMYHSNNYRYQQQSQQQYNHHQGHRQFYQQQQQQQQPMRHETVYRVPAGEQSYYRQPSMKHHQQMHHYQKYHSYPSMQPHHPPQQQQQSYPVTNLVTFVTPLPEESHHNHHHQHDHEPLQTSENYPSDKHTHVIFKKKKNRGQSHPQPSITYHQSEPIVVADVPTHYNHPTEHPSHEDSQSYHTVTHEPAYDHYENGHSVHPHVVTITERTKAPFNYHVAGPTLAPTLEELRERHTPKRMAPFTKEQFEKAKRMMDKSKRSRGSTKLERVTEKIEKSS